MWSSSLDFYNLKRELLVHSKDFQTQQRDQSALVCHSIMPQYSSVMFVHSLSPYGSEHAHKLLSGSDSLPPTPNAESDEVLRHASCKTAADGKYSGSASHCDGHLWDSGSVTQSDRYFSVCVQLLCNRSMTPGMRPTGLACSRSGRKLHAYRCDVLNTDSFGSTDINKVVIRCYICTWFWKHSLYTY